MNGRRIIGVVVTLAGLAAFAWGLFNLIQTGTCASGGPFVVARECPEGTGLQIAGLMVGVVVGLIGGLIAGLGMMMLPLVFTTVGGSSIAAGLIDPPDGMGSFPFFFGGGFLVFGLLGFAVMGGLSQYGKRSTSGSGGGRGGTAAPGPPKTPLFREGQSPPPPTPSAPAPMATTPLVATAPPVEPPPDAGGGSPVMDRIAQLERLAELERSGAITSAEYERMKTEILSQ
jgi:hypothetical protein